MVEGDGEGVYWVIWVKWTTLFNFRFAFSYFIKIFIEKNNLQQVSILTTMALFEKSFVFLLASPAEILGTNQICMKPWACTGEQPLLWLSNRLTRLNC